MDVPLSVFIGNSLTQFVMNCAEQYLTNEHKEVRLEAVKTCSQLLTPFLNVGVCKLCFVCKRKLIDTCRFCSQFVFC